MKACGAKTRAGGTCRRAAMPNGRCSKHGGKSLVGPAAPRFRHGRYSKLLPTHLAARFTEARSDPELLAMRDEIALVDARIADVLQRVDHGESGDSWRGVERLYKRIRDALVTGDRTELSVAVVALGMRVQGSTQDYAAWQDVMALIDRRRVLVESERRRLVVMQQMLSAEQAMTLVTAVLDAVRRHVPDRRMLAAISTDLRMLLAAPETGDHDFAGKLMSRDGLRRVLRGDPANPSTSSRREAGD
jgi:hypothetical protein